MTSARWAVPACCGMRLVGARLAAGGFLRRSRSPGEMRPAGAVIFLTSQFDGRRTDCGAAGVPSDWAGGAGRSAVPLAAINGARELGPRSERDPPAARSCSTRLTSAPGRRAPHPLAPRRDTYRRADFRSAPPRPLLNSLMTYRSGPSHRPHFPLCLE